MLTPVQTVQQKDQHPGLLHLTSQIRDQVPEAEEEEEEKEKPKRVREGVRQRAISKQFASVKRVDQFESYLLLPFVGFL